MKSNALEGFSSILENVERLHLINGVKVCRRAPVITHLFFVYDDIPFCHATKAENESLQRLLNIYDLASKQQINLETTELFISPNVGMAEVKAIMDSWGVSSLQHHS